MNDDNAPLVNRNLYEKLSHVRDNGDLYVNIVRVAVDSVDMSSSDLTGTMFVYARQIRSGDTERSANNR